MWRMERAFLLIRRVWEDGERVGEWKKNTYIDSQNRKEIFVGFACLVNDGH